MLSDADRFRKQGFSYNPGDIGSYSITMGALYCRIAATVPRKHDEPRKGPSTDHQR